MSSPPRSLSPYRNLSRTEARATALPSVTDSTTLIIWTVDSDNAKTGPCLTAWIGQTFEETASSCFGCSLLAKGCYYWSGPASLGHGSAMRGNRSAPARYTLSAAIKAHKGPKVARLSGGGDIGRHASGPIVAPLLAAGFVIIGYTHHWREAIAQQWRPYLLASCETLEDVDAATALGWRTAMSSPLPPTPGERTPGGAALVQCPATKQGNEDKVSALTARMRALKGTRGGARATLAATLPAPPRPLQCSACKLCSPTATARPVSVVFPAHGNEASAI